MSKKMLIDAAHAEEVRVCVLENRKVEDFDFESSARKPLRGNIYLARVTRVEPSLQAAFVEYGGNRHGFLAFNEIHPDYYQIPVSDREALQEADAEEAALAAELDLAQRGDDDEGDEPSEDGDNETNETVHEDASDDETVASADDAEETDNNSEDASLDDAGAKAAGDANAASEEETVAVEAEAEPVSVDVEIEDIIEAAEDELVGENADAGDTTDTGDVAEETSSDDYAAMMGAAFPFVIKDVEDADTLEDREDEATNLAEEKRAHRRALLEKYREAKRKRARLIRNYKIQEVIKRRQILLIQVVKEERGNKGAALTSYMSLAGRYCVLMPNTARGGGISRKIPSASDRKRLRRVVDSLDVSQGMGLIIRTAGAKRTKTEIKRDYDYLMRLWETIRALTLESMAPCLIYEEASLIKRAIRDLYDKDISKVLVEGEDGYREAKNFMKMLMPSHAKYVQRYKEKLPLFIKHDVETQLDAMYQPTVRLKSGGYLVINQTEALIAVDVNSGKATRERNIELTALKTNLEAAVETARQCRLRDLAGLIVIDFIDMEENKNNRSVEKKLKEALKHDRARIQVGRISNFGLLEMSRQRRRSGIVDGTTNACPTCNGAGAVRSNEMAALRILRAVESEAIAGRAAVIAIKASLDVTMFVLNHKRDWLKRLEDDYAMTVEVIADEKKHGDQYEIEKRGAPRPQSETSSVVRADLADAIVDEESNDIPAESENSDVEEKPARKRRRRRRKKRTDADAETIETTDSENTADADSDEAEAGKTSEASSNEGDSDGDGERKKRRRRGRRGGRKKSRRTETSADAENSDAERPEADQPRQEQTVASEENSDDDQSGSTENGFAPNEVEQPRQDYSNTKNETAAAPEAEVGEDIVETPPPIDNAPSPEEIAERVKNRKPSRKGWWSRALGG